MKDLLKKLTLSKGENKAKSLKEALEYGDDGINLIIANLNDPELVVRAEAFRILQNNKSQEIDNALADGILLNPGDTIYCVYQSVIQYNDNWWYLLDSFYEILEDYDWECTKTISLHLNRKNAEQSAGDFHFQEVSFGNICPFEINQTGENDDYFRKYFSYIFEWCRLHGISVKMPENNQDYNLNKSALLLEEYLEESFIKNKNYKLLSQLWLDAVGRFAFVQPMTVQEIMYFRPEDIVGC